MSIITFHVNNVPTLHLLSGLFSFTIASGFLSLHDPTWTTCSSKSHCHGKLDFVDQFLNTVALGNLMFDATANWMLLFFSYSPRVFFYVYIPVYPFIVLGWLGCPQFCYHEALFFMFWGVFPPQKKKFELLISPTSSIF